MKGDSVNPEGQSRYTHVRAKMARKENTGMEKKGHGKAPPKRKTIRVESEETQDNVRESLNLSRWEAEDISCAPSALSVPRGPMFGCDHRCSDKALRFAQGGSMERRSTDPEDGRRGCQAVGPL